MYITYYVYSDVCFHKKIMVVLTFPPKLLQLSKIVSSINIDNNNVSSLANTKYHSKRSEHFP